MGEEREIERDIERYNNKERVRVTAIVTPVLTL